MTVELLDVATVPAYLAAHPELAGGVDPATAEVREVGDGNLNLVFIARDAAGASVVLKQSLPYVRTDQSWAVPQDRIFAEARGYAAAARTSAGATPRYFGLDAERRLIALEDLSSWTVWRTALNEGRITRGAGADLGRYIARLAFGTSAFGLPAGEVRAAAAAALNPELCKITEDLVFTEPFRDHEHNGWDAAVTPAVLALRDDAVLAEVAELKWRFLTAAEGLLHGDLHTGSVFVASSTESAPPSPLVEAPTPLVEVRPSTGSGTAQRASKPLGRGVSLRASKPLGRGASLRASKPAPTTEAGVVAKAFDLEFGAYGPIAFDLGALFGNYLLAQSRAAALNRAPEFRAWVAALPGETWAAFEAEFRLLWPTRVDPAYTDAFLESWLRETWHRAVGFGGIKAVRRVVGWAKVSDIQSLDEPQRVHAAGAALTAARSWIVDRHAFADATALAEATDAAVASWR